MALDKAIKKKVIEDWQNAFPQLTMYAQNKLYKIVGPCIIGIELIKSPHTEGYSPYFVIYSLWGNRMGKDIKACLTGPIVLRDFKNKKGYEYDIPYEKHDVFFNDVLDSVKNQTPLPFEGDISFKKIVTAIDDSSKIPPLSAVPNSYLQAALQEAKLKIALFVGVGEARNVLEQINTRNWDKKSFNMWDVDLNEWLQSLQTTILNKDEFLKQIEANKQDKKIAKLKSSELIA
jgi:hypothetical protein